MNYCHLGAVFGLDCFKALKLFCMYRMSTESTAREGRVKPLLGLKAYCDNTPSPFVCGH